MTPTSTAPPAATTRLAPQPPDRILWSVLLAWLVPGLGHGVAGFRRQGILLFLLVGGTFAAGLGISHLEAVSRDLHPFAFWAEIGFGGASLLLSWIDPARDLLLEGAAVSRPQIVPRFADTGLLFCSIAGLLNMLVLLDLVDRMLGKGKEPGA